MRQNTSIAAGGLGPEALEPSAPFLRPVSAEELPIRRLRHGRGFVYRDAQGRRIADKAVLNRIRSLVIPPAYREVRIAAHPDDRLQAVGRDEAGRLQYVYHPGWDAVRESRKEERLAVLCRTLPRIRARVARALRQPDMSREKALAAVVFLLDRTHIRIGCEDYVHSGRSRGAATLLKRNVRRRGDEILLCFRGKGGHEFACGLAAPSFLPVLEQLRRLPGRRLFQYRDESGAVRPVRSADANAYLRAIAQASVTAKDFRTLAATATAGAQLAALDRAASPAQRKRQVAGVMKAVADLLGNTPAVARKSYVHRRLVAAFADGMLHALYERHRASRHLSRAEAVVATLFADSRRDA